MRNHPRATFVTMFLAGALLAMVTSAGLIEERSSSGDPSVALVVNAVVTFAAILVLGLVQRRGAVSCSVVLPQVLGALCGIAAVHAAVRMGAVAAPSWLSERPLQFMNDVVAAFCTLALVWACARSLDLRLLVGALVAVSAYRAAAPLWHLDAPPNGFALRVQDIVIAQFAATALALPLYRKMTRYAD